MASKQQDSEQSQFEKAEEGDEVVVQIPEVDMDGNETGEMVEFEAGVVGAYHDSEVPHIRVKIGGYREIQEDDFVEISEKQKYA